MKLTAIYVPCKEGGFVGYVLEVPGANTQGETIEETRANLKDALELVLEGNRELAEEGIEVKGAMRESLFALVA